MEQIKGRQVDDGWIDIGEGERERRVGRWGGGEQIKGKLETKCVWTG